MKLLAPAALAVLIGGSASAATLSYSDSISLQSTNWGPLTLSLTQFDSSLGTLNSVTFTLSGNVEGSAGAESLDASPSTVTLDLGAAIEADIAGLGSSGVADITINPVNSQTIGLTAFDGTIDFAGTSGVDTGTVTGSDSNFATYASGLAPFIGGGTFDVDLSADGEFSGSGAGNLVTRSNTSASASITVLYDYTPAVIPLPASALLLLGGLGGLAMVRRRSA
jgi:hypothetical protein